MPIAQDRFRGFAYKKSGGMSYTTPRAVRNINFTFNEEALERDHHWNQYADPYAPDPGAQSVDGSFEVDLHAGSVSDIGDLLEGAVGEVDTASALVHNSGGTNDATTFAFSSGTPSRIVKVFDGASWWIVPVDAYGGGQATLGVELPNGTVPDGCANPSDESGACYNFKPGNVAAQLYQIEVDRRKAPNEEVYNATTVAIYGAEFLYELRKRAAMRFQMRGAAFTRPTPPSSVITDTTKYSNPFISFLGDILLAPASPTPALDDGFTRVKRIQFGFAPDVMPETGSKGLDGSTSSAGSDVLAYTRMGFEMRVSILLTYPPGDDTYYNAWRAGTAYKLFGVHVAGAPGATSPPDGRFAYYFPRMVLAEKPEEVSDGGQIALQTVWAVERDTTVNDWTSLYHMAFFF